MWLVLGRKRSPVEKIPHEVPTAGASDEGSDKVVVCLVFEGGCQRGLPQTKTTLYGCRVQVVLGPQRRKVSSKVGDNFSVEERGKECYAELKISCKVFDVVVRSFKAIVA